MPFKGKPKKAEKETLKKEKEPVNPQLIKVLKWVVGVLLTLFLIIMLLARVTKNDPKSEALNGVLRMPENGVAQVVAPIQNVFSNITDTVVAYLRKLKLRDNLEIEYNKLKDEYDQLVPRAMLADHLQTQLAAYQDMYGEISLNESMQPIPATVIGQDESNYNATFTINKGLRDGIKDYMVVTVGGALAGYTINTKETTASVKAIIDTDASIPALIESTRDQGNIRGTLGTDGTAMCRMYHTDNYIPRPGDRVITSGFVMGFPKGIPIGIVRESTRGMEANKQFILVEPFVDFRHIEYVIVYRYQPTPQPVQGSASSAAKLEFIPLDSPRPMPSMEVIAPGIQGAISPTASVSPSQTPSASPSETPLVTIPPAISINPEDEIVFQDPNAKVTETPIPSPTNSPTPTPTAQVTTDDLTVEADD